MSAATPENILAWVNSMQSFVSGPGSGVGTSHLDRDGRLRDRGTT